MNRIDKLVMQYSDKMLDINNAVDMDYGDKTGAYMAIARQLISDTATQIANEDLDLEDLML
jgi:hypothetical protein